MKLANHTGLWDTNVAERTSYFCLARKLIWPLGSMHIFTQCGWLILFSPDHFSGQHQTGEGLPNTLFLRTFRKGQMYLLSTLFISSSITTPLGKPSNLWTSWVYSHRPRVSIWIWIRWIQYATHRNHFTSPPNLAISTVMQNSAQTSGYFIPGQHFLETRFSPQTSRTTHSWVTTSSLSLTSKQDFCYTYGNHILHIQQCLNPNNAHFVQAFSW